ncbi:RNA polymerase sigma-I factor [Ruminiclostridium papyrosolvens]|uniref:RNA polymerase sigma factor SigI n=1 Tax=Ruminiclostridium papyrosolvens C7 TaxID=1330534 RepID=U4R443_9FIRM|nr:RNA polymerase sigma-I factor [Ruminiclostridium papyrosolvens]EPR13346.1 RNA polymerase sigma factor [Ruminiclostridium papyrosolvens C7]
MTILNLFSKSLKKAQSIEETVAKIKNGETHLKEGLIDDYKPFILKVISTVTGKFVDTKNSDELSIGLMAFNEAIESYNSDKNVGFLNFAETVIKRRIVDYLRKDYKNRKVYPFTYFQTNDFDNKDIIENKYMVVEASTFFDNVELKEEIDLFRTRLKDFGISLSDLVGNVPKHADSKKMAIGIARILWENKSLSDMLITKKTIPMSQLMKIVQVNRKTVERNRKFIIAVYLILNSRLEVLQEYVSNIEKGGNNHGK